MSGPPQQRLLPDATARYADHADGVLDVHLPEPATTAAPTAAPRAAPTGTPPGARTVVLLHGGFWRTAYDRTHTRPMARALADAGWIVVTPEYRRVGPDGAGGWPATADDVRRATAAVPRVLADLGADVDPSSASGPAPLVVTGHSAGGHLALVVAASDLPVSHVVALAPVADLAEALRRRLGSDAARAFLGAVAPEEADPMVLLDRRPTASVSLVHGRDDDVVPVELSRNLVARHPWIRLHEVPGGHFEPIEPGSVAWPTVLAALASGG